jgi:Mg2+ and Co2+ transporter CorA
MRSPDTDGIRARLFDADDPDRRADLDEALAMDPTERQLLWVDVTGNVEGDEAARIADQFGLQPRTQAALRRQGHDPLVALHGEYLHVRVSADPSDEEPERTGWLDVITTKKAVLTQHDRPIPFLEDLDNRIERDAAAGSLSSGAFFVAIMDAAIASYHAAVDEIEDDVDRLDAESLRGSDREQLLGDLVRCRRRIARLRRLLADHRNVFTALAAPDVASVIDDPDGPSMLEGLKSRYDGAIGAVEDSRDALLGSFDVYMSRTAQRTNEVMKILTIATVLLLPGSVVAGFLGMNVIVPLNKDDPASFWLVVGAMLVLAVTVLLAARAKRWI